MSAFWDVMKWTGLIVWACVVILAVIVLTRPYRARHEQPVGDDALAMVRPGVKRLPPEPREDADEVLERWMEEGQGNG